MHILNQIALQWALAQAETPVEPQGFERFLREFGIVPLLFLVAYFLIIRPAQQQGKKQQETLKALKKDDEIITNGGIYGKIHAIEDKLIVLEVANGVRIKILRSSIAGKWNPQQPVPAGAAQAKE